MKQQGLENWQIATKGGQGADRRILILAHKATVAFDIGAENCGQLTLKTFLRHRKSIFLRFQNENGEKLQYVVKIIDSQKSLGGQELS